MSQALTFYEGHSFYEGLTWWFVWERLGQGLRERYEVPKELPRDLRLLILKLAAAEDTFAPWQFSNPWFGTLRGRAGIAFNNVLLFGTAGLAYGEMTAITSGNSESHRSLGWVAGLGAELSFAQHWSAKAEWIYFDLDDRHFSATTANNGLAANLVRLGLNYRF